MTEDILASGSSGLHGKSHIKSRKSSCQGCHARKTKCDQIRPLCTSCVRRKTTCVYPENVITLKPTPKSQCDNSFRSGIKDGVDSLNEDGAPTTLEIAQDTYATNGLVGRFWRRSPSTSGDVGASESKSNMGIRKRMMAESTEDDQNVGVMELIDHERDEVDELDSESDVEGPGQDGFPVRSNAGRGNDTSEMYDKVDEELLQLASGPPKKKNRKSIIPQAQSRTSTRHQHSPSPIIKILSTAGSRHVAFTDSYSHRIQALLSRLPNRNIRDILIDSFFTDPFLAEGISLLQPLFIEGYGALLGRQLGQFVEGGTTILALVFSILAAAVRILPKETSGLLLASEAVHLGGSHTALPDLVSEHPASLGDGHDQPLDERYLDLAFYSMRIAEKHDSPSIMLVMLKLILYRYYMIHHKQMIVAGGLLAQGIKIAQALGFGKEWKGVSHLQSETKRRLMWALYIADREHSFTPYTMTDAHQGIHLPSPHSDQELSVIPSDQPLPSHNTADGPTPCTALFIHTHLARHLTPILDSVASVSSSKIPLELVRHFDDSLVTFHMALPAYLRLHPYTDTQFDATHPYLLPHRLRLHATMLRLRTTIHRSNLYTYLNPKSSSEERNVPAQSYLVALRVQRSARLLNVKIASRIFDLHTVFESAATIAMIMYVDKRLGPDAMDSQDFLALREGTMVAAELICSASAEDPSLAARAAFILHELMKRVEAPLPSEPSVKMQELQTHDERPPTPSTSSPGSDASRLGHGRLSSWVQGLVDDGVSIEYLMRHISWSGGWEKVIAGM
ncbi:hypothetical protein BCR39DRAFT_277842 [Naematelia encephala]|uniref:Zn(2)-C6 fungal-type domain-containing protein n=1 Tax=Naematelia encephala TaxID=71784 RepID=A0A1Y2ATA1_9TREE|nr:hypothetical protein BCR39DRAFT_277842 [Naematelia encephala]